MAETAFDVILFEDITGDWKKLGSGSFGNVYKGSYLGIDVAIKEVLPSTEYDVAKYFEREWRLMKEARHPNVVLYLGLSRAPDGRIFIISEYIENGNLRGYIHDKSQPFPWRLRISFAIDICRALAYLHARRCIHRDLKGENLLLTANGRLKITDFGFARIAARNADETKRLTFCGTDAYMSPEILLGAPFDLSTDLFSLGIIFCEIASRRLADDDHFHRAPPYFTINADEVRSRANVGCPDSFLDLTLDCLKEDTSARPSMKEVLERLQIIELEIIARPSEQDDQHVGSVKFMTAGRRRPAPTRPIPSFGMDKTNDGQPVGDDHSSGEDSDDEDVMQAVMGLEAVDLGLGSPDDTDGYEHVVNAPQSAISSSPSSEYSTTVIRGPPAHATTRSSILTARPAPNPDSVLTIDSFHTAGDSVLSIAAATAATEGGSAIDGDVTPNPQGSAITPVSSPPPQTPSPAPSSYKALFHRFTLIKHGTRRSSSGGGNSGGERESWSPFDFFFTTGLLVARCDLCGKRLGWRQALECDDCGLRTHIKCGDFAPRDCGTRPVRRPNPSIGARNSKR